MAPPTSRARRIAAHYSKDRSGGTSCREGPLRLADHGRVRAAIRVTERVNSRSRPWTPLVQYGGGFRRQRNGSRAFTLSPVSTGALASARGTYGNSLPGNGDGPQNRLLMISSCTSLS